MWPRCASYRVQYPVHLLAIRYDRLPVYQYLQVSIHDLEVVIGVVIRELISKGGCRS